MRDKSLPKMEGICSHSLRTSLAILPFVEERCSGLCRGGHARLELTPSIFSTASYALVRVRHAAALAHLIIAPCPLKQVRSRRMDAWFAQLARSLCDWESRHAVCGLPVSCYRFQCLVWGCQVATHTGMADNWCLVSKHLWFVYCHNAMPKREDR